MVYSFIFKARLKAENTPKMWFLVLNNMVKKTFRSIYLAHLNQRKEPTSEASFPLHNQVARFL